MGLALPRRPAGLTPAARVLWDVIAPRALRRRGTALDSSLLGVFCETYVEYVTYREMARGAEGERREQLDAAARACWLLSREFAADFRLIPAERTRLALLDEHGGDAELKRCLSPSSSGTP